MALIIIRVLMGLAGGMLFPALSVLLAAWVPEKERGKLAVFVLGGGQVCVKSQLRFNVVSRINWICFNF